MPRAIRSFPAVLRERAALVDERLAPSRRVALLAACLRVALLAACLGFALAAGGCASYTQSALEIRNSLSRGDLEGAQTYLEKKKPGGDGLPYLMELGLVLRLKGDYAASNQAFERAEQVVDELYTKSLSRELLALATSDEVIPYDGEMWERALINYFRALNYVSLGELDEALVECRKVNHKLKVYVDSSEDPPTYKTDAFAQYMTGVLYEATGELNDAWVSLRLADEAYGFYETDYGVARPTALVSDFLRLADQLGEREVFEKLREREPGASFLPTSKLLDKGEIVVFYEEGFVPPKIQQEIVLPILSHEYSDDHVTYARTLAGRVHTVPHYEKTELEYLLRVAVPTYAPEGAGPRSGWAVVSAGGDSVRSEMAEDVSRIARKGLEDRFGSILFKTVLRGLTKYALTRGAAKKGEVAEKLVNIFTAVLEKADTRSWITLPNSIQVARLIVEPGAHDVRVRCYSASGNLLETASFDSVAVGPGEVKILSHRTF